MKIIICGDIHMDLVDGDLKRNPDINESLNEIIDEAIRLKKSDDVAFIQLGDVYHVNNPTSQANALILKACRRLEDAKIQSFWMVGNHDSINQPDKISALEVIKAVNFKYIEVADMPRSICLDGYKTWFWLLPHVSKAIVAKEGFDDINEFWKHWICQATKDHENDTIYAFAHHNIEGAVSGSESWMIKGDEQILPRQLFQNSNVKCVFNGHIHKPQAFKKGKTTVVIVGSIECFNMGERSDEKSFVTLEI